MHLEKVLVHMDRRSCGSLLRQDDPNTLTRQSYNTNDAPRDPPPWPCYMESCLDTA